MSLYKNIYERCWFPFFEGVIKKRDTARIYREMQKTQWLSHEELLRLQGDSLRRLLSHAESRSPFYRERFRKAGLVPSEIRSPEDLRCLPLLTKDDIRKNYGDLVCEDTSLVWTKTTGGSTGEPLSFGYTKDSYAWRVALSRRGYAWTGASPGTKQAMIWGAALTPPTTLQRLKQNFHHMIDRQLYFNCYHFDDASMQSCLESLRRYRPEIIIGYTNPLYNFAKFAASSGALGFRPQAVICAAEKLHGFQRDLLKDVFHSEVFNTYGSREFMLIASECERHGLHTSMENLIVEVVKGDGSLANDGECGRIVVTDLHNFGMPFIRYEIGDMAIASTATCSCGRGLSLLGDIVGRSLDMIEVSGGKKLPGEFFVHLMLDYPEVQKFQVVQNPKKDITLKIVPSERFTADKVGEMMCKMRDASGPDVAINCQIVDEIPLTASGKYRVAISEIEESADA